MGSRTPHCRTVTKPRKHHPRDDLSWNTCQDLYTIVIHSLLEAALDRVKMLLKYHLGINCYSQYNKVVRLLQYVPPIVNSGDWGCVVRDMQTMIVFVFLAFNFIPQRSHHSLTLPRSRIRDSATVTISPEESRQY